MAKRRRRRSDGGAGTTVIIAVLVALIVALIGTFIFFKLEAGRRVPVVASTNCPVTGPVSVTAVLLDMTDPVAPATLQNIENEFSHLITEIPEGGLVSIYGLTEKTGEITEKFSACSPGDGTNVNPLIANPRQAKQQWEDGYRKPFSDFIKQIGNESKASRSPIMAGIQQIDLTVFQTSSAPPGRKRLIVVSDMIEHTDAFSNYRTGADYSQFVKSPAHAMFATDLRNVAVTIFFIQRLNAPVDAISLLDEFWGAWFNANHTESVNVIRLAGAS